MKTRMGKIFGIGLQIVGALALIGIVAAGVRIVPWFLPGGPKIDRVTPEKAMFVLNRGQLGGAGSDTLRL